MRHRVVYSLTLSICAVMAMVFLTVMKADAQQRPFVVMVDPAHGGEDRGVSLDAFQEKDITLRLALLIRGQARNIPGLQINLTRTGDKKMSTNERVKAAKEAGADCLLSLHLNAGFGEKASGCEIYFPGFNGGNVGNGNSGPIIKDMARNKQLNDSVLFSQSLQSALETVFPRKWRGLRDAPFPLLEKLDIPALVLEVGFVTHTADRKFFEDSGKLQAVAAAIARGIGEYGRNATR